MILTRSPLGGVMDPLEPLETLETLECLETLEIRSNSMTGTFT